MNICPVNSENSSTEDYKPNSPLSEQYNISCIALNNSLVKVLTIIAVVIY